MIHECAWFWLVHIPITSIFSDTTSKFHTLTIFISFNTDNNITYRISCNIDVPTTVSVCSLMWLILNKSVCACSHITYQRFGDKWVIKYVLLPVLSSNILHSCYQAKGQYSAKGKVSEPCKMTAYRNSLQLKMEESEVKLIFLSYRYSVEYKDSKRRIAEGPGKESWIFNKLFHHLPGEIDENHTKDLSARLAEVWVETQIRGLSNTKQERLPRMCKTVPTNCSILLMGFSFHVTIIWSGRWETHMC